MHICVCVSSQDSIHLFYISYKPVLFSKTKIQTHVARDSLQNKADDNDTSQVQQQIGGGVTA
jgi:hypothetical protein